MPSNQTQQTHQSRTSTKYVVEFPEYPSMSQRPFTVMLQQEINQHDVLTLKYVQFGAFFNKALKTKTPVKVTWKTGNGITGEFHGYVWSVKRTRAAQLEQNIEVVCLGTSFDLKTPRQKVWANRTVSEVVSEIAKRNKLKPVVTQSSVRYSQLSQHGETEWEFLKNLADKTGYAVYIKGTSLYFKSIDDIIEKCMGTIPILFFENPHIAPFSAPIERTLDKFEPEYGDYLTRPGMEKNSSKTVSGVDPVKAVSFKNTQSTTATKKLKTNKTPVLFEEVSVNRVANSKEVSKATAEARAAKARFTIPAYFEGQGDPRISPYSLVEIEGIDSTSDGYWLVKKVTHTFGQNGQYSCFGWVLSDGRGETLTTPTRKKSSGSVPSLNLRDFNDGDTLTKPDSPRLSKPVSPEFSSPTTYTIGSRNWR